MRIVVLFCLCISTLVQQNVLCAHEHASGTNSAEENLPQHEFYFTRGMFSDDFSFGDDLGGSWSIDYPNADRHFLLALNRLSIIDSSADENAVRLTDPALTELPLIYALEVGSMQLVEAEVEALREYLLGGGFLFIDDFWGSWALNNLTEQMKLVFPDRDIVDIPASHHIFDIVYDIEKIEQVPNLHNGIAFDRTGITHEDDGKVPQVNGIFDDNGNLMVLIVWNSDLGDAWEWADHPQYPSQFTSYAVKLGINIVIYAMTH